MKKILTRRTFLAASGTAGLAAAAIYTTRRGIRFPQLNFEPASAKLDLNHSSIKVSGEQIIRTQRSISNRIHFRAVAPEPSLTLIANQASSIKISVGNLATDAELLNSSKAIQEQRNGINRILDINMSRGQSLELKWKLPELQEYTFASIGDSGGNHELAWCIQRAHALGARFLLHLGDFNYQQGDYDRSVDLFNSAPLPCYVSIGNHDFHDDGLIYQQFLNEIGPFNNAFTIGKTRYANIDTAASFLPFSSGKRGQLFDLMASDPNRYTDTVAFTHKPLCDPAGESDHDIGNRRERDWLISALKNVGAKSLLSGHIHIFNRTDFKGIDNIIVGQGLGHQDIMANQDISKMAIGQVDSDGSVSYRFANLAMPMELHCHPRTDFVKDSLIESDLNLDLIESINQACLKTS